MSIAQRRRYAPATARNRDPILAVLRRILPEQGLVLEVSSGTGEHAAYFSRAFDALRWQPSDVDPGALESIEAWRSDGSEQLRAPIQLDASADLWPIDAADAVVNINMIHISPWSACEGLMRGAGRILPEGGILFLYGPYRVADVETAASNQAFDASLRERDPAWGLRDAETVRAEAERHGLVFEQRVDMPANNFSLIFRRVAR